MRCVFVGLWAGFWREAWLAALCVPERTLPPLLCHCPGVIKTSITSPYIKVCATQLQQFLPKEPDPGTDSTLSCVHIDCAIRDSVSSHGI